MITVALTFNRGGMADPVTIDRREISLSLFGHCEEQRIDGEDWWLFGRRPFSLHRRAAGSRFRYATSALELRISTGS